MNVVMAMDFGLRYIGVAVGQTITHSASGVATLICPTKTPGKPRWDELTRLIDAHKPDTLVVGLPLNMDDTEALITDQARTFAKALVNRYGLPVHMHDERLSSHEALQQLQHAQALGQAKTDHELAACLILEGWFNAN